MSAVQNAMNQCRALTLQARDTAMSLKKAGTLPDFLNMGPLGTNPFSQLQDQSANQRRYAAYKGWVYSAVHALATEASKQPVMVGRLAGSKGEPGKTKGATSVIPQGKYMSQYLRQKMPLRMQRKTADTEMEIITDHKLVDLMEKPNPIQYKMQFVYSFVANLCLTGWAYVVAGTGKDGKPEFYSLPTTWVIPDHTKGAFSQFRIVNPKNSAAAADQEPLDRSQVAFAYLPNPTDPLCALAPAQAQASAIKIDDHIQSSQAMFFENGMFPSAIVTMGRNPHPDVPGGIRPRLTGPQRRQVYSAIKKVSSGVANYGNPVILDGLIESVERLSATSNEMGWEKSEGKIRTRILSSYGVHPFILGEEMAGSYAQAFIVQDRFCQRVNVFLDMLSTLMSDFAPPLLESVKEKAIAKEKPAGKKLMVWWEEAEAKDQQREQATWDAARNRDDVTQNEYRGFMGLPPDEDRNESHINKTSVQPVAAIAAQVKAGTLDPKQAIAIFKGMGLPDKVAKEIAGDGPSEEELAAQQGGVDEFGNPVEAAPAGGQPGAAAPAGGAAEAGGEEEADYADYWKSAKAARMSISSYKSMDDIIREAKGLLVP